jgi:acyl-CoA synthetase (NDP forming)
LWCPREVSWRSCPPCSTPRGGVALIGASGKPGKVGRMFMDRFVESGFENLYPVNLKETEILGFKAYPNVKEIPCGPPMRSPSCPRTRTSAIRIHLTELTKAEACPVS